MTRTYKLISNRKYNRVIDQINKLRTSTLTLTQYEKKCVNLDPTHLIILLNLTTVLIYSCRVLAK